MSPAAPAAALVWPICDFTDPRAHQVPARPDCAVDLGQRRHLGRVADPRAGAVRLDQFDGVGRHAGRLVRLPQRLDLAGRPRGVDRRCPCRRWRCRRRGSRRKCGRRRARRRPAASAPRMPSPSPRMVPSPAASNGLALPVGDRAGVLLKHMYMKMSLNVSMPPVSDHVGPAGRQFQRGQVHGAERTGAGGIDDAVGAAQVEAVGDAAGDHVAQQARETNSPASRRRNRRCAAPRRRRRRRRRRLPASACRQMRMAEPGPQRDDQFQRAGDAEDDADALRSNVASPAP